jgi:hypothetical protein
MSTYVTVSFDGDTKAVRRIVDALESIATSLEVIMEKKVEKETKTIKIRTIDGKQRIIR